MSASGSSTCASKPAETSTSSGLELRHGRLHGVLERVEVLLVARAGGHRDVQGRVPLLRRPAASGIERPLVERAEEDAVVVPEDRLRAVAVVDVEVDDRDALEAELALRRARRDRDVVEQAEAHRPVGQRVVARAAGRARSRRGAPPRSPCRPRATPPRSSSRCRSCRSRATAAPPSACTRSTCCGVWQRRSSSSVARRPSLQRCWCSSSTASRSGRSGWCPVGWRCASAGCVRTSIGRSSQRGQPLGELAQAEAVGEGRRLRPLWCLVFEGRKRGGGVHRRDSPVQP